MNVKIDQFNFRTKLKLIQNQHCKRYPGQRFIVISNNPVLCLFSVQMSDLSRHLGRDEDKI